MDNKLRSYQVMNLQAGDAFQHDCDWVGVLVPYIIISIVVNSSNVARVCLRFVPPRNAIFLNFN